MDINIATGIVEKAHEEGADAEVISLREDYSGRSMYGDKCAAIVVEDVPALCRAIAIYAAFLELGVDDGEIEDLCMACESMRTDNMGHGLVVY